ncbi:MAG TPA: DEAD/DEAH box helicase [Clostridiaceae bacterium]|nr:DEAD/DEAH box helicase [Clostridiaceae bacterium]
MTVNKPSHWLLDNVSDKDYTKAFEIADTRLVISSLNKTNLNDNEEFEAENKFIQNIADFIELATIDLMAKKDELTDTDKNQLCIMYQHLFHLLRVLPIPDDDIIKIKFIYRLIAFSYLGQKWESGRRYIIDNKNAIIVETMEKDTWDVRMFKNTYSAFIHLIRKETWDDLSNACYIITKLRNDQKSFERLYLDNLEQGDKLGGAYELIGLYHYAKAIDVVTTYMLNGNSGVSNVREQVKFHFDKSIEAAERSFNIEMSLLMQLLKETLLQMISNSIWCVTERINSKVTRFVNSITRASRPIFELLYPQRVAVLEQGLLDPAPRAVVVDLPTSSGKTLIAEFRILQALNQFAEDGGWVAYVVPTRALVNQVTARLRKDFSSIGIKVEKMSGAIEIDSFEENIITENDKNNRFDVLVTTPEKLNLLIRDGIEEKINRKLVLAVIDEAHNISDKERGLTLELLMANIRNDCQKANFLLLTPFVPNSYDIARWLDQDSPKSISISLNWRPNDRVIGAIYPDGSGRNWKIIFETLFTSKEQIQLEKRIFISEQAPLNITRSKLTKGLLAVAAAKELSNRKGILIICPTLDDCWNVANKLYDQTKDEAVDEDVELVKKFISSELGTDFKLIDLLNRRIGIHHSGLPDEIRYLMEWLMEKGKLDFLVATTTIAQGINFPVSAILMITYWQQNKGYSKEMSSRDFWNLIGRCGRTEQSSLGIVGIIIGNKEKKKEEELTELRQYLKQNVEALVSNLVDMIEKAVQLGQELDLSSLAYKPEWSQFLQYITHMFNQCSGIDEFNSKAELFLRRTYGYSHCSREKQVIILEAIKRYGQKLNKNKKNAKLSDSTGFSFETINNIIENAKLLGIDCTIWSGSNIFSQNSSLKDLMGIMLTIPEIRNNLNEIIPSKRAPKGDTLANITIDWVSGYDIETIALKYFGSKSEKALTDCCKAIFGKLINAATWGLASLQKVSPIGVDINELPQKERLRLKNLPAMIYYGVNTDEAILMRMNNVPRGIAVNLGSKFKNQYQDIYKVSPSHVYKWLSELPESEWYSAVPPQKKLNGSEYKRIWKILNGEG